MHRSGLGEENWSGPLSRQPRAHTPSSRRMIERRTITSRDEWLEWRKPFVTASQVGALFGAHPYLTALKLYCMKAGMEFPEKDNPAMRRGRLFEPAVALAVSEERPEWEIERANSFFGDLDTKMAA